MGAGYCPQPDCGSDSYYTMSATVTASWF
jgi:hypothetical protein